MALFNVSLLATLTVPRDVRAALERLVGAQERIALSLEAIVTKLNEPPDPSDPVIVGEIQVGDAVEQPTQGA